MKLNGKSAIVTGAGAGIGRAIATSGDAGYVTGTTIDVNGGMHMR